jgi:predicted dehydrogenase
MPKKLNIGFIGTGGISHRHYRQTMATKHGRVAALTEPDDGALRNFYKAYPEARELPVYRDYKEMLAREPLDGVVILSPHVYHYEQITTCLEKGLHVLTEKPMVNSIKHAHAIIAKAKAANRVLMIAYQRHYEPTFRYMRDVIARGKLGTIQYVQAIQAQEWLRLTRGTWRQDKELSGGGQLNDSGSHLIDIIMWVTGLKIKEVYARSDNFEAPVDINTTLTMLFDNGALGSMSIIGNAPAWREDHSIVGTGGALYLRDTTLEHIDAKGKPVKIRLPKYVKNPNANFVDAILGKDEPQTPPICGLRTIEVTEAAWKSAARGKAVDVT